MKQPSLLTLRSRRPRARQTSNLGTWSLHDPNQKWVNDQPLFWVTNLSLFCCSFFFFFFFFFRVMDTPGMGQTSKHPKAAGVCPCPPFTRADFFGVSAYFGPQPPHESHGRELRCDV